MGGLFGIVFIIAIVLIIFNGILHYIKNENSPVISTKARLVNKKADVHTHFDANGVMATNETFYLFYELDTESTLKFAVPGRIYRDAPENEWGTLTFQGTRFIKFECSDGILER